MNLRWQYGWLHARLGPVYNISYKDCVMELCPARRRRFGKEVQFQCHTGAWMDANQYWWATFQPHPGLNLLRRLKQWRAVVVEERELGNRPSLLQMLRKLFGEHVDRAQWRQRMKTCPKCPVYDRELRRCRGPQIGEQPPAGCGCFVPFLALIKQPYRSADGKRTGCWGRALMGENFGWK